MFRSLPLVVLCLAGVALGLQIDRDLNQADMSNENMVLVRRPQHSEDVKGKTPY